VSLGCSLPNTPGFCSQAELVSQLHKVAVGIFLLQKRLSIAESTTVGEVDRFNTTFDAIWSWFQLLECHLPGYFDVRESRSCDVVTENHSLPDEIRVEISDD